MKIYRVVYNDDTFAFIEAESYAEAFSIGEKLQQEDVDSCVYVMHTKDATITEEDGFRTLVIRWFGKDEFHSLYNEAAV